MTRHLLIPRITSRQCLQYRQCSLRLSLNDCIVVLQKLQTKNMVTILFLAGDKYGFICFSHAQCITLQNLFFIDACSFLILDCLGCVFPYRIVIHTICKCGEGEQKFYSLICFGHKQWCSGKVTSSKGDSLRILRERLPCHPDGDVFVT